MTMHDRPPETDADESLTHFDEAGAAHMVNVGGKPISHRIAVAEAFVTAAPDTIRRIRSGETSKGDVLAVARLAGIMGSKRTADLIPLCHPLPLDTVSITFEFSDDGDDQPPLRILATAEVQARTGIEMEALTAAMTAALTIYDMVKAIDRGVEIGPIRLVEKRGGRSGHWKRTAD